MTAPDAKFPRPRGQLPQRQARAFTLLELMLVVIILAMLMTIAVPGISRMYNSAKRSGMSMSTIRLLESACAQFRIDFGHIPPSHDNNYSGWQGAQLLPLFLTGYAGDADGDGKAEEGRLDEDDGLDGYGFRLVRAGQVYGPYTGTEKVSVKMFAPGPRPVFVDAFGNPIFYYVWRGGQFHSSDNDTGDLKGPLMEDAKYAKDGDNRYFRRDFILVSAGPDGRFTSFGSSPSTDDVTNFLRED